MAPYIAPGTVHRTPYIAPAAIREKLVTLPQADDPEIQAFLNAAVSENGAPIELLNDKVVQWLNEHNMEKDFSIRRSR